MYFYILHLHFYVSDSWYINISEIFYTYLHITMKLYYITHSIRILQTHSTQSHNNIMQFVFLLYLAYSWGSSDSFTLFCNLYHDVVVWWLLLILKVCSCKHISKLLLIYCFKLYYCSKSCVFINCNSITKNQAIKPR